MDEGQRSPGRPMGEGDGDVETKMERLGAETE